MLPFVYSYMYNILFNMESYKSRDTVQYIEELMM